ncbi:MAG: hypothetical protein AAGE52_19325 [Myxococcota bacterium]
MRTLSSILLLAAAVLTVPARAQTPAELVVAVASAGETGGATRQGPMREGSLRNGQSRRFSAAIPAGQCLHWVAASSARNLDVSIHRGRTILARDTETGPRASARHCAGDRRETVQLVVRAFRGSGAFAAAAYLQAPGAASTAEATGTTPLQRLRELAETHGRGYIPVTPPRREELLAGTHVDRTVPLTPGRCYRVFAAGAASLTNVNLEVLAPTGASLQSDGTEHATPTLGVLRPLCPASPGTYQVRIEAASGAGAVVWRVLGSGEAATQTAVAEAFPVGGRGNGFLPQQMRRQHSRSGRGAMPVTDLTSGQLRRSRTADVQVSVRAGRCYRALAVGMPSVRQLSLDVRDQFDQSRATADADEAPHVRFCPAVTATWVVRVKMELGYGGWGAQLFEE